MTSETTSSGEVLNGEMQMIVGTGAQNVEGLVTRKGDDAGIAAH